MTVASVFALDIPAPSDSLFTNGERALSPSAVITDATTGTYRLAKKLNIKAGVYYLKLLMAPGGTFTYNGATFTGGQLITTQIDVPVGEQRIDVTLVKAAAGVPCFVAFAIFQSDRLAYTSDSPGWVWDTSVIAGGDVPASDDPRFALPVFGVLPNWQEGVTERVAYLTDVMTSETGNEQRRAIREFPRRSIEARFLRSDILRTRLDAFLVGVGRKEFMVPLWHEQYRTVADVGVGESYHQFSTATDLLDVREFRADDLVLITNGDPTDQDVCSVASVDYVTNRLYWAKKPSKTWDAGVRLIPMRKAVLVDSATLTNMSDRVGSVPMRFDLADVERNVSADWGYCAPLWRFKIDRGTNVTVDYARTAYELDNNSGTVDYTDPGDRAHVTSRFAMVMKGRSDVLMLRQFIHAARGKAVRFYAPSFTHDLVPADDIEGLYFDVDTIGFAEMMPAPQWARRIIGIYFNDDAPPIFRRIVSVSEQLGYGGKVDRFMVDKELPPIPMTKVERISFVVPSRFDQDAFEFSHLVDQSAAVRTSIVTRSVDGTDMPDIECTSTSRPYPLDALDSFDASFAPNDSRLQPVPLPMDEIGTTFTPTSGTLVVPLITTAPQIETIDASMTPTAGSLVIPLVTTAPQVETLDTIMAPTSGELKDVYIAYNNYTPETIDASMTPTSGEFVETYSWNDLDVAWDSTEAAWGDLNGA